LLTSYKSIFDFSNKLLIRALKSAFGNIIYVKSDHDESNLKKGNIRAEHALPKISKTSYLVITSEQYRQKDYNLKGICSWQDLKFD